jgi:hypothetical protein
MILMFISWMSRLHWLEFCIQSQSSALHSRCNNASILLVMSRVFVVLVPECMFCTIHVKESGLGYTVHVAAFFVGMYLTACASR